MEQGLHVAGRRGIDVELPLDGLVVGQLVDLGDDVFGTRGSPGASGLGLGYIFLGGGDLIWVEMQAGFQVIPELDAIRALALAYALQGLSMVAVASLAVCASCALGRSASAAGVTVAFLLLSGMVQVMPFESLEAVKPYLLTTHMAAFEHVLDDVVDWAQIRTASLWVTGYAAAGVVGAIAIMSRREVRC